MKLSRTILAVAIAAVLVPGVTRAEHGRFGGGGPFGGGPMGDGDPGMLFPMVLRSLDLNADQQQKVHDIMQAHRARFRDLFGQLRNAQRDMGDKLFAPGQVQASDLTPAIQNITKLRQEVMQEGAQVAIEVRNVLNKDQLAKAADLRKRMDSLREQMKQLLGE